MSPSAAKRIAEEDLGEEEEGEDDGAPLPEPTGEALERLRAQIDAARAHFAAGGKGIPHEVVMERLRAIRTGR